MSNILPPPLLKDAYDAFYNSFRQCDWTVCSAGEVMTAVITHHDVATAVVEHYTVQLTLTKLVVDQLAGRVVQLTTNAPAGYGAPVVGGCLNAIKDVMAGQDWQFLVAVLPEPNRLLNQIFWQMRYGMTGYNSTDTPAAKYIFVFRNGSPCGAATMQAIIETLPS